jgi:hypothetical protein
VIAIIVACDKPTEPGLRHVKPEATRFDLVPSDPPDLTPAELNDPSQIVIVSGTDSVYANQSIVIVRFQDEATQAQRQAAVDSIRGVVIGGRPSAGGPDGYYYVSIAGDSTGDSVTVAADRLTALSQVRFASPYYYLPGTALSYLRPVDGTNWSSWKLAKTDVGSEHNWAPELMNLPLAWGCSTGDTSVHIGVIDAAFHSVADNAGNVKYFTRHNAITTNATDVLTWHGDAVTDVLAAVGNDSTGMTGTMWRASVYQDDAGVMDSTGTGYVMDNSGVDPRLSIDLIAKALDKAVASQGARLVNISVGAHYPSGHVLTAREDSAVQREALYLHDQLVDFDHKSIPRPLLVISAGNETVDAAIAALPLLAHMAADSSRVLVVAASTNSTSSSSSIASFSNYGSLPQVAAPGENIWAIDAAGDEVNISGTSFSTAAVTGIAGLLYSFDPRLTADSVKRLIILGAQQSGLVATSGHGDTYPIVDAYASLKLAAKRTGAPICGNQVWAANHNIYVGRDSASTPEILVSTGDTTWDVDVFHGGKWIDYQTPSGGGHLRFTSGAWGATDGPDFTDTPNGSYASGYGQSHDWTAYAAVSVYDSSSEPGVPSGVERATVYVYDSLYNQDSAYVDLSNGSPPGLTRQTAYVPIAYPQRGDTALVAISRMQQKLNLLPYQCTIYETDSTRTCYYNQFIYSPDTTLIYSLNVHGGTPTLHFVRAMPDTIVYSMAFSENDSSVAAVFGAQIDSSYPDKSTLLFCSIQFRNSRMGGTPQRAISSDEACDGSFDRKTFGTFSADRIPNRSAFGRLLKKRPSSPLKRHAPPTPPDATLQMKRRSKGENPPVLPNAQRPPAGGGR